MEEALDAVLHILRSREGGIEFVDLVRHVIAKTGVDEATAKASILRLHFEGKARIDSDWSVCLALAESKETELVAAAA